MKSDYLEFPAKVAVLPLRFVVTYHFETNFYKLTTIESKINFFLNEEPKLRVAVSGMKSMMDAVAAGPQIQAPH
jgi:hypothetical protein